MKYRHDWICAVAAIAGAASIGAASPGRPAPLASAPVVENERQFAAYSFDHGIREGFRAYSSLHSINLRPNGVVVTGQALMTSLFAPRPGPPPHSAQWWPIHAGISESRDLGFTTGPVGGPPGDEAPKNTEGAVVSAYYFTIWHKEANGRWTIIIDRPSYSLGGPVYTPDSPVTELPQAAPAPRPGPEIAVARVAELEAQLAADAGIDARAALPSRLADDAWITGSGLPPAHGRSEFAKELSNRPAKLASTPLGAGASAAGDLVYTYGKVSWAGSGAEQQGYYVRIWQQRGATWKIVVDQTTGDAPPFELPQPPKRAKPAN
jgi:ketosteroid isomerase-like protein